MSSILKGLLEPRIKNVLSGFGENEYTGPPDPATAQDKFASELAQAIATAVQQYINTNVQTVVAPGPVPHVHKILAP